ncbi:MAG: glycosyltransferase [Gammaproteobacteria bacterium]
MLRASISLNIENTTAERYAFEGTYKSDVSIQVYGMFKSCLSIANVATQFALQLRSKIDGVAIHSYNGLPFFHAELGANAYLNKSAPIGFFYGLPNEVPEFFFDHELTIGGFVCETTAIPDEWVTACNRFDLIVVPSQFCKTAFVYSGVNVPIMVVLHGLEPEYRPLKEKKRETPFIFYDTFNADSFPDRKGCEELIRCFKRAFDGRGDVRLRLRIQQNSKVMNYIKQNDAFSLISLDRPDSAATGKFAAIYSDVHCTVHPAKGEGFGLIPFQSIACATPVIAAKSSGMAEYLTENNAMILRTKGEIVADDVYYKSGQYYAIDEEHLVELLRYAEANWEHEYQKVRQFAADFRKQYSWESVLADFVELLDQLTKLDNPVQKRELIREQVNGQ